GGSWFVGAFEALTLKPPALPEDTYSLKQKENKYRLPKCFAVSKDWLNADTSTKFLLLLQLKYILCNRISYFLHKVRASFSEVQHEAITPCPDYWDDGSVDK
ncbi:hypothetical protein, partial [Phytobacter sp. V91]|uniref:hypothetical protein n=1 Tax=Phytobacter sp. V91 TaxID=3369425 RepID=UPI003F6104BD